MKTKRKVGILAQINWKLFLYDIIKIVTPLLVSYFIPDNAPREAIITVVLYVFALILGVDSFIKTAKYIKRKGMNGKN